MSAAVLPVLELFGQPGCHLCADARAQLERVALAHPFELREIDITADDGLHAAYLERIPVVRLDGVELFEHFVDEGALVVALRASPSTVSA